MRLIFITLPAAVVCDNAHQVASMITYPLEAFQSRAFDGSLSPVERLRRISSMMRVGVLARRVQRSLAPLAALHP
jgi:hypothetical protein